MRAGLDFQCGRLSGTPVLQRIGSINCRFGFEGFLVGRCHSSLCCVTHLLIKGILLNSNFLDPKGFYARVSKNKSCCLKKPIEECCVGNGAYAKEVRALSRIIKQNNGFPPVVSHLFAWKMREQLQLESGHII